MKIAVLGAGALGCAIGATLTEGGHETWLIDRSPAHVEAMRRDGLRVDDTGGSRHVRVHATTQAAEVGAADLVVVLVKSFHTETAMRGAQALVLGAKIRAALDGRFNAAFDDVRQTALPALRHRIILNYEAEAEGMTADRVLQALLAHVPEAR